MAFPLRRLLRSIAYFMASFAMLALFFVALLPVPWSLSLSSNPETRRTAS